MLPTAQKRLKANHKRQRALSSSVRTPKPLPLCLSSLTVIPPVKIYNLVLSHVLQTDISRSIFGYPGAPVPQWQEQEANPILAHFQLHLWGMWEEKGRRFVAAPLYPAGRERMGNSWARCLQKRTKPNGCLAREDMFGESEQTISALKKAKKCNKQPLRLILVRLREIIVSQLEFSAQYFEFTMFTCSCVIYV